MNKEEIIKSYSWMTDSIFRVLVTEGIITRVSKPGLGRGGGSEKGTYSANSIEVLDAIERTRESNVRMTDSVYVVLWEGHEVDFEKLQGRLFLELQGAGDYLTKMDLLARDELAIEDLADRRLPKRRPGKPSQTEKKQRGFQKDIEQEKIKQEFDLFKQLANQSSVAEYFLNLNSGLDLDEDAKQLFDKWFSLEEWHSLVSRTTIEDLRQVHHSILILKEYIRIFQETSPPQLFEQWQLLFKCLMHPVFLRIYTFLLLKPSIREWVLGLDDPSTKDQWAIHAQQAQEELLRKGGEEE